MTKRPINKYDFNLEVSLIIGYWNLFDVCNLVIGV